MRIKVYLKIGLYFWSIANFSVQFCMMKWAKYILDWVGDDYADRGIVRGNVIVKSFIDGGYFLFLIFCFLSVLTYWFFFRKNEIHQGVILSYIPVVLYCLFCSMILAVHRINYFY